MSRQREMSKILSSISQDGVQEAHRAFGDRMARSLHLYSRRVRQNHGGTIIDRSKSYRDGAIKPVSRADIRVRFLALLLTIVPAAQACEEDLVPLFACEAANGRKLVELCASSPSKRSPAILSTGLALSARKTPSNPSNSNIRKRAPDCSDASSRPLTCIDASTPNLFASFPVLTATLSSPAQRARASWMPVSGCATGESVNRPSSLATKDPVSTFSSLGVWFLATMKPRSVLRASSELTYPARTGAAQSFARLKR
jgi:hypothetical protein